MRISGSAMVDGLRCEFVGFGWDEEIGLCSEEEEDSCVMFGIDVCT
jgi:hypothetical protein